MNRCFVPPVAALVLLAAAACSPSPAPTEPAAAGAAPTAAAGAVTPAAAGVPARAVEGAELSGCLATPRGAGCPAWIDPAVQAAAATCRDAGGKPAAGPAVAWSLDLQGDGRPEYLYEIGQNVSCEGAWSVFSCGSLGCPLALAEERDGAWTEIGGVFVADPGKVEVLPGPASYRDLKIGCIDGERCEEHALWRWTGRGYEPVERTLRGTRIDVAGSPHGLYALLARTTVTALPAPGAAAVGEYDAGTEVALIGQAGDHYYVSPCNACESGFVPKAAVRDALP